jgi:hypothetical protein
MKTNDFINKTVNESVDQYEYNDEAGMIKNNLHTIVRVAKGLDKATGSNENFPEWAQEKIAVAKSMLVGVMDYIVSQHEMGKRDQLPAFSEDVAESRYNKLIELEVTESIPAAFKQGFQSGVRGLSEGNNPYDYGSPESRDWVKGLGAGAKQLAENASAGASSAGSVAAVVGELSGGMSQKELRKKQQGYSNMQTRGGPVKVKK